MKESGFDPGRMSSVFEKKCGDSSDATLLHIIPMSFEMNANTPAYLLIGFFLLHLLPQAGKEHRKYSLFALAVGVLVAAGIVLSKKLPRRAGDADRLLGGYCGAIRSVSMRLRVHSMTFSDPCRYTPHACIDTEYSFMRGHHDLRWRSIRVEPDFNKVYTP